MFTNHSQVLGKRISVKAGLFIIVVLILGIVFIPLVNPVNAQLPREETEEMGLPTGTIIAYFGKNIPHGWLLCDGKTIPDGRQFEMLRVMCGDSVPDLRGMFLRGANLNRDDKYRDEMQDRPVGTRQMDSFRSHNHGLRDGTRLAVRQQGGDGNPQVPGAETTIFHGEGGFETRPKNVAVNWLIKI